VWEPWVEDHWGPEAQVQEPPQVVQEGQQFLWLAGDHKRPRQELGTNVASMGKEVE
jgi:hypothetical protein